MTDLARHHRTYSLHGYSLARTLRLPPDARVTAVKWSPWSEYLDVLVEDRAEFPPVGPGERPPTVIVAVSSDGVTERLLHGGEVVDEQVSPGLISRLLRLPKTLNIPDWFCTDSVRGDGWGSRGSECDICERGMFDGTEVATRDAWEQHYDVHRAWVAALVHEAITGDVR